MNEQHVISISHALDDDQIIEPVGYDFGFTRRSFVQVLGAGLLIAATAGPTIAQQPPPPQRRRGGGGFRGQAEPIELGARLHIAKDGTITVMTGKVEGGQGSRAQITQAAAEELRVPVEQIRLIMADTTLCPDDGMTVGSRTTPSTLPPVRQACAAARQLLEALSAQRQKQLSYADLAAAEQTDQAWQRIVPRDVQVTPVKEWTVLGQSVPRPNRRDIVTGAHEFPSDITRPGMLYGKILRPPAFRAKLKSIDLSPAKGIDGVVVARDGDFVGVAAPNTHLAKRAIMALEKTAQWDPAPHPDSATVFDYLRRHARGGVPENQFKDDLASAATVLSAKYDVAYIQHAPLEPRAAVAQWEDGSVTVWTATQNPFGVRRELSSAFHVSENRVRVIVPDFGGAFGGKHTGETAIEAARLAQAARRPVALRWTRAEEFMWAVFRPAAAIDIEASLDREGRLTSWHFVNINSGRAAVQTPYRVPRSNDLYVESDAPLRHGSYRALAATANNFARECFMDELAAAAQQDPLAFRLAHLDDARLRNVLEEVARRSNWTDRRRTREDNAGIGLACGREKGSYVAAWAEVQVDRELGTFYVRRIVQTFECGKITTPANLLAQVEGCIIMGLGPALREAIAFEGGRITNGSFWKYEVPRLKDLPELEIHLLDRPDLPPAGAGETPLIAVAPAIANALFHATGTPVRQMPIRLQPTPPPPALQR